MVRVVCDVISLISSLDRFIYECPLVANITRKRKITFYFYCTMR